MEIYTIDELAEILDFQHHMHRKKGDDEYNIYKKTIVFEGESFCYTLTESPPNVGYKGTRYRLNLDYRENSTDTNINCADLEEFNKLIRELKHFRKIFRDDKINKILNSDE